VERKLEKTYFKIGRSPPATKKTKQRTKSNGRSRKVKRNFTCKILLNFTD